MSDDPLEPLKQTLLALQDDAPEHLPYGILRHPPLCAKAKAMVASAGPDLAAQLEQVIATDDVLAAPATEVLALLGPEVIPVLVKCLERSTATRGPELPRLALIHTLLEFGPAARAARPVLVKLQDKAETVEANLIDWALKAIDAG